MLAKAPKMVLEKRDNGGGAKQPVEVQDVCGWGFSTWLWGEISGDLKWDRREKTHFFRRTERHALSIKKKTQGKTSFGWGGCEVKRQGEKARRSTKTGTKF